MKNRGRFLGNGSTGVPRKEEAGEQKRKESEERAGKDRRVPKWSGVWGVVPIRDFKENGEGNGAW